MMANLISMLRTLLCLIVVALLFIPTKTIYLTCFWLTIVVIWMDGLDGYVARKYNESSKAGAVIDILGDRIVEQVYWITFLAFQWIPLWIPLTIIIRGVLVDGIRSIALEQGFTAFGQATMQQSKLGQFLVSSNASRWLYAFFKAIAFASLILTHTPSISEEWENLSHQLGYASVYISVAFCIIRGLPVLIEGRRFFLPPKANTPQN